MQKVISSFRGEYAFLSNFYKCYFDYKCYICSSVEHIFQAMKCEDTTNGFLSILNASTPSEAKRIGRKVKMRSDWNNVRLSVMEDILRAKFSNAELRDKLLSTGDTELIEGNTWGDTFWGCVWKDNKWQGKNHLGKILMKIREELRNKRN